jgi:protein-tyrosine phosphatase
MIDLHNHILPGVDDGAVDFEESLSIARQFVAEGVTEVVATPHLDPLNRRGPHGQHVRHLVGELQQALAAADVPLEVVPGHEVFLTPEIVELLDTGVALPLAQGNWVLVEVPFNQRPLYLDDTLFQLELAGYRPILAHPERYSFVQRDPAGVSDMVERGVVLQLTAPALLGEYGGVVRRTSETLLRNGLYALAASDRHHSDQRRGLDRLHARIAEIAGLARADLLLKENTRRVFAGDDIERPEMRAPSQRSLFGRLFRA